MNVFLPEKPGRVDVLAYDGDAGAEHPTRVRYTYLLGVPPDDVWLLCWGLPSTGRAAPLPDTARARVDGAELSFECRPEELDEARAQIERRLIEANAQKDAVLSRRQRRAGTEDEAARREIIQRLNDELGRSLDIATPQAQAPEAQHDAPDSGATRLEDWG